jgi:hypothetical protein
MLARIAAQGLCDGLAAVALYAHVFAVLRRGTRSALESRLVLAFGALGLFFAFRAIEELSGHPELNLAARLLACPLPVMALILAEGLVRRHAPFALKAGITLGALALGIVLLAFGGNESPVWSFWLGGYVTLSLLAVTILLLTRDRITLSHQENAGINALILAGVGLILLDLTDFIDSAPLGMSGLGAVLLVFFARANPNSARGVRSAVADLLLIATICAAFAIGLAQALTMADAADLLRLGTATMALGIVLTTALGGFRDRRGRDEARAMRTALAASDTSSLTAFLDPLADQPLLRGLRLAEGGLLADYNPDALGTALMARPVWTRQALADPDAQGPQGGREELSDLMVRSEASHAGLISRNPLRIALLTLPEIGEADGAVTDLALFCKLAAIAAKESA